MPQASVMPRLIYRPVFNFISPLTPHRTISLLLEYILQLLYVKADSQEQRGLYIYKIPTDVFMQRYVVKYTSKCVFIPLFFHLFIIYLHEENEGVLLASKTLKSS